MEQSAEIDAPTLRLAAAALEAQPPKLRAQYVATLRLYADEPWRLAHDCATCQGCIHNGNKCCGCYDNACCQTWDTPPGQPRD